MTSINLFEGLHPLTQKIVGSNMTKIFNHEFNLDRPPYYDVTLSLNNLDYIIEEYFQNQNKEIKK